MLKILMQNFVFKDTFRTIKDIYSIKNNYVLEILTLIDQNIELCKLVNFLRYYLRFVSAYLVLAFTIQRLLVIYKPFNTRNKSKRSAWRSVCSIVWIGFILNSVVPFLFHLKAFIKTSKIGLKQKIIYCDVIESVRLEYLLLILIYSLIIIIVPSIIIIVSNCLIIYKTNKQKKLRNILMEPSRYQNKISSKSADKSDLNLISMKSIQKTHSSLAIIDDTKSISADQTSNIYCKAKIVNNEQTIIHTKIKPFYWTAEQISKGNNKKLKRSSTKLLTMMLLTISFSFVALNVPHFIIWLAYFYKTAFQVFDPVSSNIWFGILQITEIFYLLNYSIKFLLCLTFSIFRDKVKKLGIFVLI
jgi:hypothetical protein